MKQLQKALLLVSMAASSILVSSPGNTLYANESPSQNLTPEAQQVLSDWQSLSKPIAELDSGLKQLRAEERFRGMGEVEFQTLQGRIDSANRDSIESGKYLFEWLASQSEDEKALILSSWSKSVEQQKEKLLALSGDIEVFRSRLSELETLIRMQASYETSKNLSDFKNELGTASQLLDRLSVQIEELVKSTQKFNQDYSSDSKDALKLAIASARMNLDVSRAEARECAALTAPSPDAAPSAETSAEITVQKSAEMLKRVRTLTESIQLQLNDLKNRESEIAQILAQEEIARIKKEVRNEDIRSARESLRTYLVEIERLHQHAEAFKWLSFTKATAAGFLLGGADADTLKLLNHRATSLEIVCSSHYLQYDFFSREIENAARNDSAIRPIERQIHEYLHGLTESQLMIHNLMGDAQVSASQLRDAISVVDHNWTTNSREDLDHEFALVKLRDSLQNEQLNMRQDVEQLNANSLKLNGSVLVLERTRNKLQLSKKLSSLDSGYLVLIEKIDANLKSRNEERLSRGRLTQRIVANRSAIVRFKKESTSLLSLTKKISQIRETTDRILQILPIIETLDLELSSLENSKQFDRWVQKKTGTKDRTKWTKIRRNLVLDNAKILSTNIDFVEDFLKKSLSLIQEYKQLSSGTNNTIIK